MSEYFTSFTMDYDSVIADLELCDIVEFNRLTYSHYGFHIGDGILVHVTGDEDTKSSGNVKKGRKTAMRLKKIADRSSCRINNLDASHFWRSVGSIGTRVIVRRSTGAAIELATRGLPKDDEGKVVLGATVDVSYLLFGANCEAYSTYWRYELPEGLAVSQQAYNPIFGSTLGTCQRLGDEAAAGYMTLAKNKDNPMIGRVAATGAAVISKSAAITVGTVKAVADGATSVAAGAIGGIISIFK